MAAHANLAIWLSVNFEESEGSVTTIEELFNHCQHLTPRHSKDVIAKVVTLIFKVQPTMCYQNGERYMAYKNLKTKSENPNKQISLPSYCQQVIQTSALFKFKCPVNTIVNGKLLYCTVTISDTDTVVSFEEHVIKCGYSLNMDQMSIDGIILALQNFRMCNGVNFENKKLPKTFSVEMVSFLHDENYPRKVGRSKHCKNFLPLLGKVNACAACSDGYNKFKRRSDAISSSNLDISPSPAKQPRQPCSDITNDTCIRQAVSGIEPCNEPTLNLSKESDSDMQTLLASIIQDDNAGEFLTLLKSQLRNCQKTLEPRQRRWDPKVISVCLGILLKSPQAYKTLKESGMLVLPSRRLLQYYKNLVKQHPGTNKKNLEWMRNEYKRQNISEFGSHGGILIDEMTIQDDLVITKSGDSWNIVGMVDMGTTNNDISIITNGRKKVGMATHALQFVFHGFTGFRWPVVYYGSSTATAHELYTTFWNCVDNVDEYGFTVEYVMLDGASTNRSFTNMILSNPRENKFIFPDVFYRQHLMCAIQDVMHVLKKIRNNIESSSSKSTSVRYLVLDDSPVVWDHWRECFNFNFQNGFHIHRKLTEEHINLTPASKMRNHLASQVLDRDMLYLMKTYQLTLADPDRLSSSVNFLKHTSAIVSTFCDRDRPICALTDQRISTLLTVLNFFNKWETSIKNSPSYVIKKNLMTQETRDDLNSSLRGFISICELHVKNGNSINPGFFNSDLIENLFCQQRGIRNGLNSNPTLAQYGPSNTAIILGQHSVSNKCNSGTSAALYNAIKPCPLNKRKKRSLRSIRM